MKSLIILFLTLLSFKNVSSVMVSPPPNLQDDYCIVKSPEDSYIFNFFGLSNDLHDSKIRLNERDFLRVHFCRPLVKPCKGEDGYSICLHKNGEEIGVGKDRPFVDITKGKITFNYLGDECNGTHRYEVILEMHCDFTMGDKTSIDWDLNADPENHCYIYLIVDTMAACAERKQTQCSLTDNSGHYDLSSLTDYANNYEVEIHPNVTAVLNVCHSLIFGEHYAGCDADTAICLIDKSNHSTTNYYSIGELVGSRIIRQGGLLATEFVGGTICKANGISGVMRSSITYICDLFAPTNSQPEYIGGSNECHYLFIWKTRAACSEERLKTQSVRSQKFCTVKDPITDFEYDLTVLAHRVFTIKSNDAAYEFSVCSELRNNKCKAGSGLCKLSDSDSSTGISGGMSNGGLTWTENGVYLNYTNGHTCGKGMKKYTTVTFVCGTEDIITIEEKGCHLNLTWMTDLVCEIACSTGTDGINFSHLTNVLDNYVVKTNDSEFHLNVCHHLIHEDNSTCPRGVAACMVPLNKNDDLSKGISLGAPDIHLRHLDPARVLLKYEDGAYCEEDPNKSLSTHIIFVCDRHYEDGFPEYKNYTDCTYSFEWRTKYACGKVTATLNRDNCTVTNAIGDAYDLSSLSGNTIFKASRKTNKTYDIHICGGHDTCNGSYICDDKVIYGTNLSIITDYTNDLIQFEFYNGTKCSDGSNPRSSLSIKCNIVSSIFPILLDSGDCHIDLAWFSRTMCKPMNTSDKRANIIVADDNDTPNASKLIHALGILLSMLSGSIVVLGYLFRRRIAATPAYIYTIHFLRTNAISNWFRRRLRFTDNNLVS